MPGRRRFLAGLGLLVLGGAGGPFAPGAARAQGAHPPQLTAFELRRAADGLHLSFQTRFELPRAVEDALVKGVPLYFAAEALTYRSRWYWRDARVARASRVWRLAWQPLTRSYRVSFGGLHQTFETLPDAMAALRGVGDWRIADATQIEDGVDYVEFRYRLDTDELPRPMQIGMVGQEDWALAVERIETLK